uniref:Hemicentin-1-like n=1 Tax=Crassostrea virginica TaxID=6565 RepID=A0A8B8C112_CRAVI|nr:hemicentin-1-like [Crassostrea virginica]
MTWRGIITYLAATAAVVYSSPTNQCFNCNGVPAQEDCDVITHCGDNESCYVRKSTQYNGQALFESGCFSSQSCQVLNTISGIGKREAGLTNCYECCKTGNNTYPCNSQLCGTPASRERKCFSCSDITKPENCETIVPCSEDSICYTGSYRHPFSHEIRYNMGCQHKDTCSVFQALGHSHVTSSTNGDYTQVSHCNDCCNDDYCNIRLCGIPKKVKPVFTYKPNNSTLNPGLEGVIMVCKVEPSSNATLHWEFHGASGGTGLPSHVQVVKAPNNVNLTIFPAYRADMGEYICVATNSVGTSKTSAFLRPKAR